MSWGKRRTFKKADSGRSRTVEGELRTSSARVAGRSFHVNGNRASGCIVQTILADFQLHCQSKTCSSWRGNNRRYRSGEAELLQRGNQHAPSLCRYAVDSVCRNPHLSEEIGSDRRLQNEFSSYQVSRAWTNEEQKLLEQALKTYPVTLGTERWDKIAAVLPNR